ncbi:hypothetical protein PanWU01x14_332020, partial [Parasponia andersonii]
LVLRGLVPKDDPSFKEFVLFAALCVGTVRKERNTITHGGAVRSYEALQRALATLFACYKEIILQGRVDELVSHSHWLPPPHCWIKINVDATVRDVFSVGVAVARSERMEVIAVSSQRSVCVDSLFAEAGAC